MTTERIPGGWITWGKPFAVNWPADNPTPADRTDAWWRMKTALWSQSFPPRSAMTLIGVDLSAAPAPWPTADRQAETLAEDIAALKL